MPQFKLQKQKQLCNEQPTFAVDVSSGESAVSVQLKGCIKALRRFPHLRLLLVGDRDQITGSFKRNRRFLDSRVEIVHTTNVIGMSDEPVKSCRSNPDASVVLSARAVAEHKAFGFYSPGNTGAAVAAAIIHMGLLPGVRRPTMLTAIPSVKGFTLLADSGSNVDMDPDQYLLIAKLGSIFYRTVFQSNSCNVGLLNIGSEPGKGSKTVKQAYQLLHKHLEGFIGNIEGYDIFSNKADLIVCDGFVGNVIVKMFEAFGKNLAKMMQLRMGKQKDSPAIPVEATESFYELTGVSDRTIARHFRKLTDAENYGGAPLIGINGMAIIGHGVAGDRSVYNAIRNALYYRSISLISELKAGLEH